MAETKMNVKLLAHTQLSGEFLAELWDDERQDYGDLTDVPEGAAVALTAIRTCYSPNKPTEIIALEGAKYFGQSASDGEGGTDAERLFRHITRSGHTSTLEHLTFTFAVESVSRALLAQLTRHRVGFSFSVQSQRYVRFGSVDKSGGFNYVVPASIRERDVSDDHCVLSAYDDFETVMAMLQQVYDRLREAGVPAEDARAVLPNAAATNLVMTANLRSLLEFYGKRRKGRGAQNEICELAERLREQVTAVEPWTERFFEEA